MVYLQGCLEVTVVEAKNLCTRSNVNSYCIIELVNAKSCLEFGRTLVIEEQNNPKWHTTYSANIDQEVNEVRFTVKDKGLFKGEKLGSCSVDARFINSECDYFASINLANKKVLEVGKLTVIVKFRGRIDEPFASTSSHHRHEKSKGCSSTKVCKNKCEESCFIHGNLEISILSAKNLPASEVASNSEKSCADPFVIVAYEDPYLNVYELARSKTISNSLNPEWNETFEIALCHDIVSIHIIVYDEDMEKLEMMCNVQIHVSKLLTGDIITEGKQIPTSTSKEPIVLDYSIRFQPHHIENTYDIKYGSFKMLTENNIKFYQDPGSAALPLQLTNNRGQMHQPSGFWPDILKTLLGAKKFICIAGSNLSPGIVLDKAESGDGKTLGRVLLEQAEKGVDVRVLLDAQSDSTDSKKESPKEFFKESFIKLDVVTRNNGKNVYNHNQKCVIADEATEKNPGLRNIVAYVGSFDLCSNRYDTLEHKLGFTEDCDQRGQFYNSFIATITKSHLKVPWHDLCCKLLGKAAIDVFKNFESRWKAQAIVSNSDFKLNDSCGIYIDHSYDSLDNWNVQIFRSVSETSVNLKDWPLPHNLPRYAGRHFDDSLHRAYIHLVRNCKRFIYIETNTFIGSSYAWEGCDDIRSVNLVPAEITEKICEKIRSNQQFTAYILLSLYPEANDDSVAQEMLHWQYHTIEMMYKKIAAQIADHAAEARPQDYLVFFCLAKRREFKCTPKLLKQFSEEGSVNVMTKSKKSMIVVNSRLAVFDDEYMILGSGSISDRSLLSTRNTELAVGMYQPRLLNKGEVTLFRKSLWAEHFGQAAPLNLEPHSLKCSRKIRELCETSLKAYLDTSQTAESRNAMLYPLSVSANGVVKIHEEYEKVSSQKHSMLGYRSKTLVPSITT